MQNSKIGIYSRLLIFFAELEKQKIKLKLSQKSDWKSFFEGECKKALELADLSDRTDKEIDAMIYVLYDFADEEIAVIEPF